MSLENFFEQIGPYLLGQRAHEDTVQQLYGDAATGIDAQRLAIYGRFCRNHRRATLAGIFPYCQAVLIRRCGESGWQSIVERYFVAHPMHHFELNQNAIHFPAFISTLYDSDGLPQFIGELADFEWWEWLTESRFDEPTDADPDKGPLRLHSSVDLRPYAHDLIEWIDIDEREPEAPAQRDSVVLFYRDRELARQRESATGLTMLIIKAVVEAVPLDEKLATQLGLPLKALKAEVAELREKGVLLGAE
jgi:hypothetical protein